MNAITLHGVSAPGDGKDFFPATSTSQPSRLQATTPAAVSKTQPMEATMPDELEQAVVALWKDAGFIACAPDHKLLPHLATLAETRELVNDAIAKVERLVERRIAA